MTRAHSYLDHLGHSLDRPFAIQSTHVYIIFYESASSYPLATLLLLQHYSNTPILQTLQHPTRHCTYTQVLSSSTPYIHINPTPFFLRTTSRLPGDIDTSSGPSPRCLLSLTVQRVVFPKMCLWRQAEPSIQQPPWLKLPSINKERRLRQRQQL